MPTLIVPYRIGSSRARARAAGFIRRRLRALHPDWPLCFATEPQDGWSKAHAVNWCAVRTAHDALVIHDADCLVGPLALDAAVRVVERGCPWAIPHRLVYRLSPGTTSSTYREGIEARVRPLPRQEGQRAPYLGVPGGGVFVVSRGAWETVGGFDERFDGWGSEDAALGHALTVLCGPPWRGTGPLWHLWHPQAERTRQLDENQALEARYLHARTTDAMRTLIAEGQGVHATPLDAHNQAD